MMRIVFDLDNTLCDEHGKNLRPGAKMLLETLRKDHHNLIVWTNSVKDRANQILEELRIKAYFSKIITREDYDPNSKDGWKDIRKVKGDLIIDDNPDQEVYAKKYSYHAIVVKPFMTTRPVSSEDFDQIPQKIKKFNDYGIFKKLFGS